MAYDVLGRLRSTVSPTLVNALDPTTITPVTEFSYDEFGQRTVQMQYALGATAVSEFTGNWTSGSHGYIVTADVANHADRRTVTLYDSAGHVIEVDSPAATGGTTDYRAYTSYDALGHAARTWHTVQGRTAYAAFVYDAVGQVATSYAPSSDSRAQAQHSVDSEYTYNGFGEQLTKAVHNVVYETCDYDNNGNLWRSNAGDGVVRVYMYDMSGRQTSMVVSNGASGTDHSLATYAPKDWAVAYADIGSNDPVYRRTDTIHDKVGNVVATVAPQRENSNAGFSLIVGTLGVSSTKSYLLGVYQQNVTASWPSLAALGSGDIRVVARAMSGTTVAYTGTAYFASAAAATGAPVVIPEGSSSVVYTVNVEVSKKDINGDWQVVIQSAPNGTAVNVVGIAAPTGTAKVQFSYKSAAMPTALPGTLYNFGTLWGLGLTGVTGSVNYTSVFTYADGSTSSSSSSFTIGSALSVAATTSFIRATVNQTFDRWGNVITRSDPRLDTWLTTYNYDANNHVIRQQQGVTAAGVSLWSGFDNTGQTVTAAPTTTSYYDAQGHQVEMVDANGNKTVQRFDAAGDVLETDRGVGTSAFSKAVSVFDAFGQAVRSITGRGFDANGVALSNVSDFTTVNKYDNAGHLTSVTHGDTAGGIVQAWGVTGTGYSMQAIALNGGAKQNLTESYTYDADGNKLASTDAAGQVTSYTYDLNGHLTSTSLPMLAGQIAKTLYDYDDFGHAAKMTDADLRSETWTYDYFGKRIQAHSDLAGNTYAYVYDNAGEMTRQSSATQQQVFTFDRAGQLLRASQVIINTGVAATTVTRTTDYAYDKAGNHLTERTMQGTPSTMAVYQDNHLAYDVLGRLVDSGDGAVHLSIGYDAVGNRIHTATHTILDLALTSGTTASSASPYDTDYWNAFDALNRQTQVNWTRTRDATTGAWTSAPAWSGTAYHMLTYDADSNRLTDRHYGNIVMVNKTTTLPGGEPGVTSYKSAGLGAVTDNYVYDALDRLDHTWRGLSGKQQAIDLRTYDADGRTVSQGPGDINDPGNGSFVWADSFYAALNKDITDPDLQIGLTKTVNRYDTHGQVTASYSNTGMAWSVADYTASTVGGVQKAGYDAAGNLMGDVVTNYDSSGNTTSTQAVVNTLGWMEGYHVATTTTTVSGQSGVGTTSYDVNGGIATFRDSKQSTFNRDFVTDMQGQVISTTEGGKQLRNLVVAGQVIGQFGDGLDKVKPQNTDNTANLTERANFGFGFRQISGTAAGSGTYTVNAGDTLQSIAFAAYGDGSQWWRIAQANGVSSDSELRVGQVLRMPSVTGGTSNANGVAQPYDPSKIVGDTSAHLPTPPKSACGGAGAIIMAVVAVAVTAIVCATLGPELVGIMNPVLATLTTGAVAGAAASVASQGVGNAIGAVHGFSWKQVATSAISGAVSGGGAPSDVLLALGAAAINNVVSQGIGMLVGAQKHFSWKQVAMSGISAGISAGVAPGVEDGLHDLGVSNEWTRNLLAGTVSGVVSTTSATLAVGGKVDLGHIAADAFGNALGQGLVQRLSEVSFGGTDRHSITNEPVTLTPIQVDMSGVLPGPVNVADDNNSDGAASSHGSWTLYQDGQKVGEQSVDESQPYHPYGVLGPAVELPPINNGNPTIANAIAHGFAVEGVSDTSCTNDGFFSNLRASINEYWGESSDSAVGHSVSKYFLSESLGVLGNVGVTVGEYAKCMYESPEYALPGIIKGGFWRFGPDTFNGTTNLTKLSLDGLSMIAEKAVDSPGSLDWFRISKPFNFEEAFPYQNKSEAGYGMATQFAMNWGISKFGTYEVDFSPEAGKLSGNPKLFRLIPPDESAPTAPVDGVAPALEFSKGVKDTIMANTIAAGKALAAGDYGSAYGRLIENSVIEELGPQSVVKAGEEIKYRTAKGTLKSEIDVETANKVIQVKSGAELMKDGQMEVTLRRAQELGKTPALMYNANITPANSMLLAKYAARGFELIPRYDWAPNATAFFKQLGF